MLDKENIIYKLLLEVFSAKAYSGIKLNDELTRLDDADGRAYITKVFYGVIEKSVQFDYIISSLCDKKPKNNVIVLVKIGLYLLRYTDTPSYAAINKTVSLCKNIGKGGVSGFVNVILRKSTEINLDTAVFASQRERLSVLYSYPVWIVAKLIKQYGERETEEFLSYPKKESTHIRRNISKIDKDSFESELNVIVQKTGGTIEKSMLGYYVRHDIMKCLPANLFTAQSYASMLAVHAYLSKEEAAGGIKKVLDLCGAPGGKSVYLGQLHGDLNITCCDIYPHRTKLIEDYGQRMGVKLNVVLNDAVKLKTEWKDKFDLVICDVPCSGLGLVNSKPDIILNRSEQDIIGLAKIQYDILSTASKYLRAGGILCYSTCTVIKEENIDIINKFLSASPDFEIMPIDNGILSSEGVLQLLPHRHDCDGFFIARLRKRLG